MKERYVFRFSDSAPDLLRYENGAEVMGDDVGYEVGGISLNMANKLKKAFGGKVWRETK